MCIVKNSLICLLLGMSPTLWAGEMIFGGSGATPMPINNDTILMKSEHIVIVGNQLDANNNQADWRYSSDYRFENNSDQSLSCKMALPFLVNDHTLKISVPAGRHLRDGDPLLYDFS